MSNILILNGAQPCPFAKGELNAAFSLRTRLAYAAMRARRFWRWVFKLN